MDNDLIERVARAMCVNLGLDPDEVVDAAIVAVRTPIERREIFKGDQRAYLPDILLSAPRWRAYCGQASEAIAARLAVDAVLGRAEEQPKGPEWVMQGFTDVPDAGWIEAGREADEEG